MAHVGEELRFGLVGFLGTLGEHGKLAGLHFQLVLRLAKVRHGRHQSLFAADQLLFMLFQRRDVGADRNVAAVLGAALADLQPVAVVELRLEGARAGNRRVLAGELGADGVLAAGRDHRLVRRAGGDRRVGQTVQVLEVGVAQHQTVLVVPQHKRFRDGLDGIAETNVRRRGPLHQSLLLGDINPMPIRCTPASPGCCTSSQRTRSQTHLPLAWCMRKS